MSRTLAGDYRIAATREVVVEEPMGCTPNHVVSNLLAEIDRLRAALAREQG